MTTDVLQAAIQRMCAVTDTKALIDFFEKHAAADFSEMLAEALPIALKNKNIAFFEALLEKKLCMAAVKQVLGTQFLLIFAPEDDQHIVSPAQWVDLMLAFGITRSDVSIRCLARDNLTPDNLAYFAIEEAATNYSTGFHANLFDSLKNNTLAFPLSDSRRVAIYESVRAILYLDAFWRHDFYQHSAKDHERIQANPYSNLTQLSQFYLHYQVPLPENFLFDAVHRKEMDLLHSMFSSAKNFKISIDGMTESMAMAKDLAVFGIVFNGLHAFVEESLLFLPKALASLTKEYIGIKYNITQYLFERCGYKDILTNVLGFAKRMDCFDVTIKSQEGNNLLMHLLAKIHYYPRNTLLEVAKMLLEAAIDLSDRNKEGRTIFTRATETTACNTTEFYNLLIQKFCEQEKIHDLMELPEATLQAKLGLNKNLPILEQLPGLVPSDLDIPRARILLACNRATPTLRVRFTGQHTHNLDVSLLSCALHTGDTLSRDDLIAKGARYMPSDFRISMIHTKNKGPGAAWDDGFFVNYLEHLFIAKEPYNTLIGELIAAASGALLPNTVIAWPSGNAEILQICNAMLKKLHATHEGKDTIGSCLSLFSNEVLAETINGFKNEQYILSGRLLEVLQTFYPSLLITPPAVPLPVEIESKQEPIPTAHGTVAHLALAPSTHRNSNVAKITGKIPTFEELKSKITSMGIDIKWGAQFRISINYGFWSKVTSLQSHLEAMRKSNPGKFIALYQSNNETELKKALNKHQYLPIGDTTSMKLYNNHRP